jgi:hypothetical protein
MTLLQLLSLDERVIVLSDKATKIVITWNRSKTLQMWQQDGFGFDKWREVDSRVLTKDPKTYDKARKAAVEWMYT